MGDPVASGGELAPQGDFGRIFRGGPREVYGRMRRKVSISVRAVGAIGFVLPGGERLRMARRRAGPSGLFCRNFAGVDVPAPARSGLFCRNRVKAPAKERQSLPGAAVRGEAIEMFSVFHLGSF